MLAVPGGKHLGPYLDKILYSDNSIDIGPENILQLAVKLAYTPEHLSQRYVKGRSSGRYFCGTSKCTVRLGPKKN
jgi:hypothetical protein